MYIYRSKVDQERDKYPKGEYPKRVSEAKIPVILLHHTQDKVIYMLMYMLYIYLNIDMSICIYGLRSPSYPYTLALTHMPYRPCKIK
jgi:hypothetical protein